MEIQLNQNSLATYSNRLANQLSETFFAKNKAISSKDILHFCGIQQINLFIAKTLFEKWQAEMYQLRSPYFDYENDAVKQALKTFMNVLSQHMYIKQEDFLPLLAQAIEDTLKLILSPLSYYAQEFNKAQYAMVSIDKLKEMAKYVTVNKVLLQTLLEKLQAQPAPHWYSQEIMQHLKDIYELKKESLPYIDIQLKEFDALLPCPQESFLIVEAPPLPKKEIPIIPTSPVLKKEEIEKSINDQYAQKSPILLHDQLKTSANVENLAEKHRKNKIDQLKTNISLNQKFAFINTLCQGNHTLFNKLLNDVEMCANYSEAAEMIQKHYMTPYEWNKDQEEVMEFMELVQRRFY